MAIFAYIILGIVVGVIVRIVMPPAPQVGFWGSVLLGMVGGLIGGLINSPFQSGINVLATITPGGLALAAIIATAVTGGATLITRRRRFA